MLCIHCTIENVRNYDQYQECINDYAAFTFQFMLYSTCTVFSYTVNVITSSGCFERSATSFSTVFKVLSLEQTPMSCSLGISRDNIPTASVVYCYLLLDVLWALGTLPYSPSHSSEQCLVVSVGEELGQRLQSFKLPHQLPCPLLFSTLRYTLMHYSISTCTLMYILIHGTRVLLIAGS